MQNYKLSSVCSIVLAILVMLSTFRPSPGLYLGKRHLHIVNWLENHEKLMIQCWSEDVSFGVHILEYRTEFQWEFFDSLLQETRYDCNLAFNYEGRPRRGHFVVYDTSQEIRRRDCYKHCRWGVGVYGLYAFDENDERWDYEIPWPSKNKFD